MSSFVTNAQFLIRYDARTVGQLCSDTGNAVSSGSLPTDPNLTAALQDASGQVLMATLRGGRYSADDLNNLTDISQAYLQRLVSDLAMYLLVLRRGKSIEDYPQTTAAVEMLDQIAKGERVFNVANVVAAGVAQSPDIPIQTIINNNLLENAVRYFPSPRYTINQ